jgi:hypothetical protein
VDQTQDLGGNVRNLCFCDLFRTARLFLVEFHRTILPLPKESSRNGGFSGGFSQLTAFGQDLLLFANGDEQENEQSAFGKERSSALVVYPHGFCLSLNPSVRGLQTETGQFGPKRKIPCSAERDEPDDARESGSGGQGLGCSPNGS